MIKSNKKPKRMDKKKLFEILHKKNSLRASFGITKAEDSSLTLEEAKEIHNKIYEEPKHKLG